jgi:hypothetical protein
MSNYISPADQYRVKAAEFMAQARLEPDLQAKVKLQTLAASYLRLAEQADRNRLTDVIYETPITPKTDGTPEPESTPQS